MAKKFNRNLSPYNLPYINAYKTVIHYVPKNLSFSSNMSTPLLFLNAFERPRLTPLIDTHSKQLCILSQYQTRTEPVCWSTHLRRSSNADTAPDVCRTIEHFGVEEKDTKQLVPMQSNGVFL